MSGHKLHVCEGRLHSRLHGRLHVFYVYVRVGYVVDEFVTPYGKVGRYMAT